MPHSRRLPNQPWLLPLEDAPRMTLSESVRMDAIRTLADLLLEAASRMPSSQRKEAPRDESQDQA